MARPLVIWGTTGQALVLCEFLLPDYEVVAWVDRNTAAKAPLPGAPLVHSLEQLEDLGLAQRTPAVLAIGGARGADRLQLRHELTGRGFEVLTAVHPRAWVARDARVGEGSQLLAMSALGAHAQVGRECILNTRSSVDHECTLGNGVHIGPGAVLAGLVRVGDGSFVGTGAAVLPRVTIGQNTIVGAGAVVTRDLPDNVVAYGNPARVMRENR